MVLKLTNKKDGLKRRELLKKLQLIDNHLGGLEKRKKVLLGDLEGKQAHVQEKQNFLTEKQKEHKKFQKEIDNKELDLKCKEEEIKKFRLDLYKIKRSFWVRRPDTTLKFTAAPRKGRLSTSFLRTLCVLDTVPCYILDVNAVDGHLKGFP